jgi:hypothetical protein
MGFFQALNALSKFVLGVGLVDIWKQVPLTKAEIQKAQKLARSKHLHQAITTAQKALASWSKQPRFWQRLLLGNILDQTQQQLKQWRSQVTQAGKLVTNAKALLQQDTGNPLETTILLDALALCSSANKILHDDGILELNNHCQIELKKREQFRELLIQADSQAENRFFQNAVTLYRQAVHLYRTEALQQSIANCEAQIQQEQIYYSAFTRAKKAADEGRLRSAIALLESALIKFSRHDGIELLEQLQRIIKGNEKYHLGLKAEKAGNFNDAVSLYESADVLLQDSEDCKIRLAVVAIKTSKWITAISHLADVEVEQAAYLRGFAYAKQQNLQAAHREWQKLPGAGLAKQKESLKSLSQRQQLLVLQNIEQSVKDDNFKQAQSISKDYLQKFGFNNLVEDNLNEHILPRLEVAIWQTNNWESITSTAIKAWVNEPNMTTLHNWMVATYYLVCNDSQRVSDLIIAGFTALANLTQDVTLLDIPWLTNREVDLEAVSSELKQRIEVIIDSFKDKNINKYLELRDEYRLEITALRLMGNAPKWGIKIKNIFITPGCYQLYHSQWQIRVENVESSQKILASLYSRWGLTVAACLEGDIQRAIQIKPKPQNNLDCIEQYAVQFITYYEGCYYLQQQKWRIAISHLNQAKSEIINCWGWQLEIDRLCGLQRQFISKIADHLEFAQFWYDLLQSQPARSYLAEYKTEVVRDEVANNRISRVNALKMLENIQQIDKENPIVLDLIERIEFVEEIEEVERLIQKGLYEQVIKKAQNSRHERVRFTVAELLIKILINAAEKGDVKNYQIIQQLGHWAYEISPNEPVFQEIYRSLKIPY